MTFARCVSTCARADEETPRNLGVRVAFRGKLKHFTLAVRQRVVQIE
jgi:hypothetical protein